jgi:alanine dehydrogenase
VSHIGRVVAPFVRSRFPRRSEAAHADHRRCTNLSAIPFITEREVAEQVSLTDVIDSVGRVVEAEARGAAMNIPKTMATWGPASSAHALGAQDSDNKLVVFKTWVNTPRGASAVLTLFDSDTGAALAVIEAGTLGALRTAAIAGLATRLMSDPEADEMAIIGTGRQASRQVAAVAAVRPIKRVRVWSPREDSRERFAREVREGLEIEAQAESSLAAAVDGAPVVTLITRASEPFLGCGLLSEGAHLNAVGAILPRNAEFDPALLARADLAVVDNMENARRSSREFNAFYGDDWSRVVTLGDLVTGEIVRPESPRLTIFKGLGMGLSDLAAAAIIVARNNIREDIRV